MIDDIDRPSDEDGFLSFVKAGLEEGVAGVPRLAEIERAAARRPGLRRWTRLAAAAAVAVALALPFADFGRRGGSEAAVAQVIELLSVADGAEGMELSGAGDGDLRLAALILAWQDAPYESAISGLAMN